mgnify:CR=1 FL=1
METLLLHKFRDKTQVPCVQELLSNFGSLLTIQRRFGHTVGAHAKVGEDWIFISSLY